MSHWWGGEGLFLGSLKPGSDRLSTVTARGTVSLLWARSPAVTTIGDLRLPCGGKCADSSLLGPGAAGQARPREHACSNRKPVLCDFSVTGEDPNLLPWQRRGIVCLKSHLNGKSRYSKENSHLTLLANTSAATTPPPPAQVKLQYVIFFKLHVILLGKAGLAH